MLLEREVYSIYFLWEISFIVRSLVGEIGFLCNGIFIKFSLDMISININIEGLE